MSTDPPEKPEPRRTEASGESNIRSTQTRRDSRPRAPLPDDAGPYKVLDVLGEGGMGVVYLAEQTKPIRRRVALKIIKLGMDTKQVIARFETERQALAMMNHPGVAKVFDAGTTEQGRPYFVMEYVPGVPITEHCDRHKLNIEERLHLFMQLCDAVQHAHQKGVIHRDIKPKNVLVSVKDEPPHPPLGKGGPAAHPALGKGGAAAHPALGKGGPGGVAKVIDFGVAKAISQPLTEKTLFTEQGQLIGTPAYMSPEQAEMTAQDIDTRTDIYSLGVLLYELLTGDLPLDPKSLREAAFDQILHMIREFEPPKPSTKLSSIIAASDDTSTATARNRRTNPRMLTGQLRGDLDWVTMKALDKDRTRRYASASDFAADILRHLHHEPVVAGPPSATYRVRKIVRRNRGLVAGIAAVFAVLAAGVAVSTWFAVRATQARQLAETRLEQVEQAKRETEAERDRAVAAEEQQSRERQRAEQARTEAERQAAIAQAVNDFLNDDLLAAVAPEEQGKDVTMREVLDKASEAIEGRFEDEPLVEASIRTTLGVTYEALGVYKQAEPHLERALHLRRSELGDDHPGTLESISDMGHLLWAMGRYEEAEPYWADALERRRRVLGDGHPETLDSISNMGSLLQSMGKYEEAEPYYREALEARRRVLGDDHPDTLNSIGNMGGLLESMGKYDEAEPYYREGLEGLRRVLGDDHPHTLASIINMGALLYLMGKYEEAEPYFRDSLEGSRRVLGDDHPHTLTSIHNMGLLVKSMGKFTEAEPHLREALEGCRRVLGDDHPSTLRSINNMGVLLELMDKYAEAEPYFREAMEGKRRVLGDDHPDTLTSINNMGALLQSMGKLEEAEPYYREALEGNRRILGGDHPSTVSSVHNLGRLLRDLGRLEEAEALGAEAVRRARQSLPEGHWFTGVFLGAYGKTLAKLERYADAETVLLEAHQILEAARGAEHERTIKVIRFLVDLYEAWDAAEPGKGYADKAAQWRAKLPTVPDQPESNAAQGEQPTTEPSTLPASTTPGTGEDEE